VGYDNPEVKQPTLQQLEAARRTILDLRQELEAERTKRLEREEEVIALNSRLEEAGRDPLTNAMTRRAFDDHIRDIVAETYPAIAAHAQQRKRKPRKQALAVLLCDTDGFKGINDTHGHESGDIVLAAVAKNLHRHVRTHQGDRLQRYGGDEFVIAFQGTTAKAVMSRFFDRALGYSKLEAMHVMLNKVDAHGKPVDIWVTMTGGVADFRMPEYPVGVPKAQVDELLRLAFKDALLRADAALYRAKELGKNRLELATDALNADPAEGVVN
jgi:diguanylate cyclase (GGDEF)-like protein